MYSFKKDRKDETYMSEREENNKHDKHTYDDRLKGTFTIVILIGLFIILSWFGVFYFYWSTI